MTALTPCVVTEAGIKLDALCMKDTKERKVWVHYTLIPQPTLGKRSVIQCVKADIDPQYIGTLYRVYKWSTPTRTLRCIYLWNISLQGWLDGSKAGAHVLPQGGYPCRTSALLATCKPEMSRKSCTLFPKYTASEDSKCCSMRELYEIINSVCRPCAWNWWMEWTVCSIREETSIVCIWRVIIPFMMMNFMIGIARRELHSHLLLPALPWFRWQWPFPRCRREEKDTWHYQLMALIMFLYVFYPPRLPTT